MGSGYPLDAVQASGRSHAHAIGVFDSNRLSELNPMV